MATFNSFTYASNSSTITPAYVTYQTQGYAEIGPAPVTPAPRNTNLSRLHDRVEATCAKARLAA